jgi:hypothetical protein
MAPSTRVRAEERMMSTRSGRDMPATSVSHTRGSIPTVARIAKTTTRRDLRTSSVYVRSSGVPSLGTPRAYTLRRAFADGDLVAPIAGCQAQGARYVVRPAPRVGAVGVDYEVVLVFSRPIRA